MPFLITAIEYGVKAIIKKNVLSISLFQGILNEVCKIFVLCNVIGGEFIENIELTEIKYFSLYEISNNLAEEKTNKEQIGLPRKSNAQSKEKCKWNS